MLKCCVFHLKTPIENLHAYYEKEMKKVRTRVAGGRKNGHKIFARRVLAIFSRQMRRLWALW